MRFHAFWLLPLAVLLAACGADEDIQSVPEATPVSFHIGSDVLQGTSRSYSADFIQSFRFNVPTNVRVVGFGIILGSIASGSSVPASMGLYTDLANNPGSLVVASANETLLVGRNEIPAAPTIIGAGDYWLATRFGGAVGWDEVSGASVTRRFLSYAFTNPWPDPHPVPGVTSSPQASVYMIVER